MEASELDKAVVYTKQFIEAITPIAKQAYEMGLVTLQIDALQTILISFVLLGAGLFGLRRVRKGWAEKSTDLRTVYGLVGIVSSTAVVAGMLKLLNLWIWAKLFYPQLWLAHQAIEKLMR